MIKTPFNFTLLIFLLTLTILPVNSSLCQEIVLTTPLQVQCSKESISNWNNITNNFYGVAGTGFIGKDEWIGLCEAKYQWGGPWRPVDGFKHTLCGNLFIKKKKSIFKSAEKNKNYHLISDGDGDMVIYISPDSTFRWLLSESLRPQGHHFKDSSLSCEVALKEPGKTIESNAVLFIRNIPLDSIQLKPVGVYGPWVSDVHHENSPEIHPVQQIWRIEQRANDTLEYQLYSLFDNSKRFSDTNDYPDSCFLNPWTTTPLINIFYVPFMISEDDSLQIVYDISIPSFNNINLYEGKAGQLRLVVNGKLRLVVNKSTNAFPEISLFDVCQSDENSIHGYLKIETSIGKENSKSGAHAILKMMKSKNILLR